MSNNNFTWIPAYEAIADALLQRKFNRGEVLALFNEIVAEDERANIDPFTFFTMFNRGIIDIDRKRIIETILNRFGIDAPLPDDFTGIPCANQEIWQYFDDSPEAVDDCWALFETALQLASEEGRNQETAERFCELFDKVHAQENITKARLTRSLYWMRPNFYLPFGEKARDYINAQYGVNAPVKMRGARYLRLLTEMDAVCDEPFYKVAAHSYQAADSSSWWPDIRDYDPDMSINQWMVILNDRDLTSEELLRVLYFIRDKGGDTTVNEIADQFLHDREYYSSLLRTYARNVARATERPSYKDSWWPILFTGRNAEKDRIGDYIWRLRPEVIDALNELDGKSE